jgi:hypothetical protein
MANEVDFNAAGRQLLAGATRSTFSVPIVHQPSPVTGEIPESPPPKPAGPPPAFAEALEKLGEQLSEVRKGLEERGVKMSPMNAEQYADGGAEQKRIMKKAAAKAVKKALKKNR